MPAYINGTTNNTPMWEATHNGLVRPSGNADVGGTAKADHINQFLGASRYIPVYYGDPVNTGASNSIAGGTGFAWLSPKATADFAQPFSFTTGMLPGSGGTSVFRVAIPMLPVGQAANVRVSLCPDQGGGNNPNMLNPIASTVIPATWLSNLGAQFGIAQGSALAHPAFNTMYASGGTQTSTWTGPSSTGGAAASGFSATTSGGNFFVMAGGQNASGAAISTVAVSAWQGGTTMAGAVSQPSLPTPSYQACLEANNSTIVYMGGFDGTNSLSTVYTASWSALTGVVGTWSTQTSLPTTMQRSSSAVNPSTGTIYIAGGVDSTNTSNSNVYYANPNNGQISGWNVGPSLPFGLWGGFMAVIGNFLFYCGGSPGISGGNPIAPLANVYYANLDPNTGNIIGGWSTNAPNLPIPVFATNAANQNLVVTDSAILIMTGDQGAGAGGVTSVCQVLTVGNNDFAPAWETFRWPENISAAWAQFQTGNNGQWMIFRMAPNSGTIRGGTIVPVPKISVPLPDFNYQLVGGTTYHIVIQVGPGADATSTVQIGLVNGGTFLPNALTQSRHSNNDQGGTWSSASIPGSSNPPYIIPMSFYTQGSKPYAANGYISKLLHTWEDWSLTPTANIAPYQAFQYNSSRVTTHTKNYKGLSTGIAEGVVSNLQYLNRDPFLLAGTTYYSPQNCTFAAAASPSPIAGVSATSGQITSTGLADAKVFADQFPVVSNWASLAENSGTVAGGFWYMFAMKIYCNTANQGINLSVAWYDVNNTFLTTTSYTVSNFPANTWKDMVAFQQPPRGAKFAQIVPVLTNSANGVILYFNSPMGFYSTECVPMHAPVVSMSYNNVVGSGAYPAAITQIA